MTLVLASGSFARRRLLENAGIAFEVETADLDERELEEPMVSDGAGAADIASALAEAKAMTVAARRPVDHVVGADQVLATRDGVVLHKPEDRGAAADQLRRLAGTDHWLHSAVALAYGDRIAWSTTESVRLTMRALTDAEIDAYLDEVPEETILSAGVYQIEGPGIRLFDTIHGDYFAILGLPLLPLLQALRDEGVIT